MIQSRVIVSASLTSQRFSPKTSPVPVTQDVYKNSEYNEQRKICRISWRGKSNFDQMLHRLPPRKDAVASFSRTTSWSLGQQILRAFIGIPKTNRFVCSEFCQCKPILKSSHCTHTHKKEPCVLNLNLTLLTTALPCQWKGEQQQLRLK